MRCEWHSVPMKAPTKSRGKMSMDEVHQVMEESFKVIGISSFTDKDGPTFSKTVRKSTSLQHGFIGTTEELRTKATSTLVDSVGNSVRDRSRVFLQT